MKQLIVLAIVVFSFAPGTPAQTGQSTANAAVRTTAVIRLTAEFTRKIDTKDAKLGDPVEARTTAKATLADGTELPKGTRLTGSVTEVRAKSNDGKNAHLGFSFDRAVLRDGHEVPIHATLTSLSAPASMGAVGGQDDTFAGVGTSTTAMGAPGGAGASAGGGTGGGLGARAARTASGAGSTTGNLASNTAGAAADAGVGVVKTAPVEGSATTGNYVTDALRLNHYPVGNMPGVVLSSQANSSVSGWLDANGRNITLGNGTQMTMNASVVVR
jgi:hypothetical protein